MNKLFIFIWKLITIFFVLTIILFNTCAINADTFTKNSVALYINYHIVNNFYSVYSDKNETPYLNVQSIMNSLLELPLVCKGYMCSAYSVQLNKNFWIDFKKKKYGFKKKSTTFQIQASKFVMESIGSGMIF